MRRTKEGFSPFKFDKLKIVIKTLFQVSANNLLMTKFLKSEKIRQNLDAVAAAGYFTYVTAMTYFSIGNTIGTHLSLAGMMLPQNIYFTHYGLREYY